MITNKNLTKDARTRRTVVDVGAVDSTLTKKPLGLFTGRNRAIIRKVWVQPWAAPTAAQDLGALKIGTLSAALDDDDAISVAAVIAVANLALGTLNALTLTTPTGVIVAKETMVNFTLAGNASQTASRISIIVEWEPLDDFPTEG